MGGIHRIPVGDVPGGLHLCGLEVVGPDPDAVLDHVGASVLVCLQTDEEILRRHPSYIDWLGTSRSHEVLRLPTPDYLVSPDDDVLSLVEVLFEHLEDGRNVLIHCGAGWGRAGVIAVLVMAAGGCTIEDAVRDLRLARPSAGPESAEQNWQVDRLGARLS